MTKLLERGCYYSATTLIISAVRIFMECKEAAGRRITMRLPNTDDFEVSYYFHITFPMKITKMAEKGVQ